MEGVSLALGPPEPPPCLNREKDDDYYLGADPSPGDLEVTLSGDAARRPEVYKPQSDLELGLRLSERTSTSSKTTSKLVSDTGLEGSFLGTRPNHVSFD